MFDEIFCPWYIGKLRRIWFQCATWSMYQVVNNDVVKRGINLRAKQYNAHNVINVSSSDFFPDTKYVYTHMEDPAFAMRRYTSTNLIIRISPPEPETSFFGVYFQKPLSKVNACHKTSGLWTNFCLISIHFGLQVKAMKRSSPSTLVIYAIVSCVRLCA